MNAAAFRLAQFLFQRGQIVERNLAPAGDQFAESLAEELIAVDRQRARRQAVEGMVADRRCPGGRWRSGRIS